MWTYFFKALFYLILSWLLRPKPDEADPPQPGNFEPAIAEEGAVVSRIYGTVYQKRFHVVWYGDRRTVEKVTTEGKK